MKTPAEWKTLFESSAFARQTNYSGPLGPEYNPSGTRLRLWAPTAQKVSVNLYRRGDGGACMGTLPLEQHGQGVWSVYLPGDQHGHYYTFTVEVDGTAYETGDPYARAAGVNGLRSMILDAPRIDPPDWNHDHRVIVPASRRTVWEVSVRDFSQDPACGVRNAWRGKFMAFTQKGTTLSSAGTFPTCLDYLKRLGVGYVQLMPIFDFGSVDESRPLTRQYNWGYDPTNYNIPEGSYSTDPTKGEVRVRECKEMIASLHAAGIGVIMDVVYNHMYRSENPLNSTVPYYFFRQNPDGSFSNGSGCGNEFASERPMARKYLIDSVLYWAQEYHIDGFRFDLMGLYDVDTMNELRAALDALPGGRNIYERYEEGEVLLDPNGVPIQEMEQVPIFEERETTYVTRKEEPVEAFWDFVKREYHILVENETDWSVEKEGVEETFRAVTVQTTISVNGKEVPYNQYLVSMGAAVDVEAEQEETDPGSFVKYVHLAYPGQNQAVQDGGTEKEPVQVLERVIRQPVRITKHISQSSYENVNTYGSVHNDPVTTFLGLFHKNGSAEGRKLLDQFSFRIYLKQNLLNIYVDDEGKILSEDISSPAYKELVQTIYLPPEDAENIGIK